MCGLDDNLNMKPVFSIIVPCYNLAPWIRACLDSVLAQSYVDWECVVVDDESKDESGAILDEYAVRDVRIRVVHQKNKGEGGSRNTGIAAARGEWVFFLDGDDVMASGALEKLSGLIDAYPQEKLIRFGYESFEDGCDWKPKTEKPSVIRKDILQSIAMDDFYTFVWQHLYRREIIEGIWFKRYIRGCDRVFVDDVLLNRVDSFVETDEVFYGYRQRASSAVHVTPSAQVLVDEMDHRCDIVKMIEGASKQVVHVGSHWLEGYFTHSVGGLIATKTSAEQTWLWREWYRCVREMKNAKGLSRRTRLIYALCSLLPFRSVWWLVCRAWPWYNTYGIVPRGMRKVLRYVR